MYLSDFIISHMLKIKNQYKGEMNNIDNKSF